MKRRLLPRLLLFYLAPAFVLLALCLAMAHRECESALEAALGRKLTAVAAAAAVQLRTERARLHPAGGEKTPLVRHLRQRLELIASRADVARLVVFDRTGKMHVDTAKGGGIGQRDDQAAVDKAQLSLVFEGQQPSSTLFRAADGRRYKTGYAPLRDGRRVVAAVAVVARARYVDGLAKVRRYLIACGTVLALVALLLSFFFARRVAAPVTVLAASAAQIGDGDLSVPVPVGQLGGVGVLAETMNEMRLNLLRRDDDMQMTLAGIAHEVRNPLSGMRLYAALLREGFCQASDAARESGDSAVERGTDQLVERVELLTRIEREIEHLGHVVDDFLHFARRHEISDQPVELKGLLQQVIDVAQADAATASVRLALQTSSVGQTRGNADQLRRGVFNLVRNAIQASPEGAVVTVVLQTRDGCACVDVIDHGEGIDAELLPKVFTPFHTTREDGVGLGLALARKVARAHGGDVTVLSSGDQGTSVRLSLPLAN